MAMNFAAITQKERLAAIEQIAINLKDLASANTDGYVVREYARMIYFLSCKHVGVLEDNREKIEKAVKGEL